MDFSSFFKRLFHLSSMDNEKVAEEGNGKVLIERKAPSVDPSILKSNDRRLDRIFNIALDGVNHFQLPLTNGGKYELIMYDVWLGQEIAVDMKTFHDFGHEIDKVEEFLKETSHKLGFPDEKKLERLYIIREDDWAADTDGLATSDYPRTKQYIPEYLYMCIMGSPTHAYTNERLAMLLADVPFDRIITFMDAFIKHYIWAVSQFQSLKN